MKNFKKIAVVLASWTLFYNASPALAALAPSKAPTSILLSSNTKRQEYIKQIQKALENKIVAQKLKEYGMSPEEVKQKLNTMNNEQLKLLANSSKKLQAGGDGLGLVIAVLVIVLLVVLILRLTGREVVIR